MRQAIIRVRKKDLDLYICNIVRGGKNGQPGVSVADIEGFAIHTRVEQKWCAKSKCYRQTTTFIKKHVMWNLFGHAWPPAPEYDLQVKLDKQAIAYLINDPACVKEPQQYRIHRFLGQEDISLLTPNFQKTTPSQRSLFHESLAQGDIDALNRTRQSFDIKECHFRLLHIVNGSQLKACFLASEEVKPPVENPRIKYLSKSDPWLRCNSCKGLGMVKRGDVHNLFSLTTSGRNT